MGGMGNQLRVLGRACPNAIPLAPVHFAAAADVDRPGTTALWRYGLSWLWMSEAGGHVALGFVARAARRSLAVRRVLLFGSRARGDARPDSDFDIAVDHGSDEGAWADFVNQMQETVPTLLDLELVDYARAPETLRRRIDEEGVALDG
jgi:predicted nucleotidyltransferase